MSDEDIRKYLPKPNDIRRRFDEEPAKHKLEEALDNPELDRALADLGNDPNTPADTPTPSRREGPWHEAPPGVTLSPALPAGTAQKPRPARARSTFWTVVSVLLAALAVTAPAILVAILKAPAPPASSLPSPATAELATTNSAVPQEPPTVVDAGQGGTASAAPDAGSERQTPELPDSSAAAPSSTAGSPASPRVPPFPPAPRKPPGAPKPAPSSNIPEDILQ